MHGILQHSEHLKRETQEPNDRANPKHAEPSWTMLKRRYIMYIIHITYHHLEYKAAKLAHSDNIL